MSKRKVDTDELRLRWLTALLSGEYKQAQSALKESVEDDVKNYEELEQSRPTHPEYCCIGVLCDVAVELGEWLKSKPTEFRVGRSKPFGAEIPPKFVELFGLSPAEQAEYIRMNDNDMRPFEAIAEAAGS